MAGTHVLSPTFSRGCGFRWRLVQPHNVLSSGLKRGPAYTSLGPCHFLPDTGEAAMSDLIEHLRSFNRKKRFILLREPSDAIPLATPSARG